MADILSLFLEISGIVLILFSGVYLSFKNKFFQIRYANHWLSKTFGSLFKSSAHQKSGESISQFSAVCSTLAATVGVGNIAGVASAIALGGPGAVFWMWVAAFFGMMTAFCENVLGALYRKRDKNGRLCGGPMYYLQGGIKNKKLGKAAACGFALFATIASFGIGNTSQVNTIAVILSSVLSKKSRLFFIILGALLALIVGIVILGGVKRIASVCEAVVPVMVVGYVLGALYIIFSNFSVADDAFRSIFKCAFGIKQAAGGVGGFAFSKVLSSGLKRGVFSNEAGLGSSAVINCSADSEPVVLGMWGIFEVFLDTIIVCTLTALCLLCSGLVDFESGALLCDESALVVKTFSGTFGDFGAVFIAVAVLLFAFASVIGWSYIGSSCFCFLFGEKRANIYKALFVMAVFFGVNMEMKLVWSISDVFNILMMLPNIFGILFLSGKVSEELKKYIKKQRP